MKCPHGDHELKDVRIWSKCCQAGSLVRDTTPEDITATEEGFPAILAQYGQIDIEETEAVICEVCNGDVTKIVYG